MVRLNGELRSRRTRPTGVRGCRLRVAGVAAHVAGMLVASVTVATTSEAHAQVACRYEIAATISAGSCSFGERTVSAVAISPNGRYVCGYYCQCLCIDYESFVFDVQTGQLFTIPREPGIFTSRANDVNDAGWVVGHMGGSPGEFGYVYDFPAQTYRAM